MFDFLIKKFKSHAKLDILYFFPCVKMRMITEAGDEIHMRKQLFYDVTSLSIEKLC